MKTVFARRRHSILEMPDRLLDWLLGRELDSPKFFNVMPLSPPFIIVPYGNEGISASYSKIPPNPPLRKGGIEDIVISMSYENFGLSR